MAWPQVSSEEAYVTWAFCALMKSLLSINMYVIHAGEQITLHPTYSVVIANWENCKVSQGWFV